MFQRVSCISLLFKSPCYGQVKVTLGIALPKKLRSQG